MPAALADESSLIWDDLSVNLPESPLRAFAVHPQDEKTIYAATRAAIWRSTDAGQTWFRIVGVVEHQWGVSEEVQEKEVRSLTPFLSRGDGESLFPKNEFSEEIRRRIYAQKVFSGATYLAIHPQNPLHLYIGTFDGLLVSENGGRDWQQRKIGVGAEEQVVLHLAISHFEPLKIYASTMGGLFISRDGGKRWKKERGLLAQETVSFILEDPQNANRIWAGTLGSGVFMTEDQGKHWSKMPVGVGDGANQVRALTLSLCENQNRLFAATDAGLYCLDPKEKSWMPCGREGALGNPVAWVHAPPQEAGLLLAAGERGLFASRDGGKSFQQLSVGVRFQGARQIIWTQGGKCFFMTPQGLFRSAMGPQQTLVDNAQVGKAPMSSPHSQGESPLWMQFRHEPSVQEVQRRAMVFAETHPEKIRAWRRGAKWRALLPRFQLGFAEDRERDRDFASVASIDRETNFSQTLESEYTYDEEAITTATFNGKRQVPVETTTNTNEGESYFSESKENSFAGSVSRERNTALELGAIWDLGNLLYNPEEIDISKEARELAELRDNILKEVTQFYFRRRHLQLEILSDQKTTPNPSPEKPPTNPSDDIRKQLELEELTAQLDALTGGWFSQQIQKK